MLPFFVDIFGCAAFYFFLMRLYAVGEQQRPATMLFRLTAAFLSIAFTLFAFDYVLNLVLATIGLFRYFDPAAGVQWIGKAFATLLIYRTIDIHAEKLTVSEILNFVSASVLFGNYFRVRDADTRSMIGTHRMKTIYEEVHGKPFSDEVIATSFDQQPTTFKKVPVEALKDRTRKPPPEYSNEVALLQQRMAADVTSSFRFELAENRSHPLLAYMHRWVIEPERRDLLIDIVFPSEKRVPIEVPAERVRLIEQVYESLHILIDLEWFSLYTPYIDRCTVVCRQMAFNDLMVEEASTIMIFRISLQDLRERASRITTGTEIQRIAQIEYP
jgi:hypothetical protein